METVNISTETIATPARSTEPIGVITPNYVKDFYSAPRDYSGFFSISPKTDEEIEKTDKLIKKLKKDLDEAEIKLGQQYAKKYTKQYEPIETPIIFKYTTRSGDRLYFDSASGLSFSSESFEAKRSSLPNPEINIIKLETKSGSTVYPVGYSYALGSVIFKEINYSISSDNATLKMKITNEYTYGVIEDNITAANFASRQTSDWEFYDILKNIDPNQFLNSFLGTSRDFTSFGVNSLYKVKRMINNNVNWEIICKTAPDCIIKYLIDTNDSIHKPIWEVANMDKDLYNQSLAAGVLEEAFTLRSLFARRTELNKTIPEMFALIKKMRDWEKDLSFYGVRYEMNWSARSELGHCEKAQLFGTLAAYYLTKTQLNTKYSFGKFVNYVVSQVVDQGFKSINDFVEELIDYLRMADANGLVPTLFSDNLKMIHDLANRNLRINVTPEDEKKFQDRYAGFRTFVCKDYKVIAPKDTKDVLNEGSNLSHCVSAYIRRVINNECVILFLRQQDNESLITIEVKDDKIVQCRGLRNRFPDEGEAEAIKKFAESRGYTLDY